MPSIFITPKEVAAYLGAVIEDSLGSWQALFLV